jgi:hypothetical protein
MDHLNVIGPFRDLPEDFSERQRGVLAGSSGNSFLSTHLFDVAGKACMIYFSYASLVVKVLVVRIMLQPTPLTVEHIGISLFSDLLIQI